MFSCRSLARLAASLVTCLGLVAAPSNSRAEMVYVTGFLTGGVYGFNSTNPEGTVVPIVPGGTLAFPTGLAFGPDGYLYVAVSAAFGGTPSIVRVDLSDNSWSTAYSFDPGILPAGLAFQGNSLLVGRTPFPANQGPVVRVNNIVGGTPAQEDYTIGGTLTSSPGIALAADGTLYVADETYDSMTGIASGPVKEFDSDRNYIDELIADGASGLEGPTGLAIAGTTLYTSSVMNGSILATDLLTSLTSVVVANIEFGTPAQTFSVGPLAVLSGGDILVGDTDGTSIFNLLRIAPTGTIIGTYDLTTPAGISSIGGIAIAPVPEPGTIAFVGIGLVGGAVMLRRRRRATMSA